MQDHPLTRDLILIGGGHAHALVLRRWGMDPLPGARLTVINPGATAPYTGMLPGHVAGHYTRDELDIDLVRLCRFAGAALIDAKATDVDAAAKRVRVEGPGWLDYDVASLDVGIHAEMPSLPGFAAHGVGAKPLDVFARAWRAHRDGPGGPVAVIGGGVAGVELAMAMAHARPGDGVTVIEAEADLTGMGARAKALLRQAMDRLGVALRTGATVERVEADAVVLTDGTRVPAALTVGAAGARPHAWIGETGLPLHEGFVRVGPTLQVEGHPDLFAAGDCAHLTHAPRPKAGVFAVREAPVLHDNLRAALAGGRMRAFRPQRSYLKLVSLGGKSALAEKGVTVAGPWLWRWKDRIDRAFMDKLTVLPAMRVEAPAVAALGGEEVAKPLCAGCGAKVGGDALAEALSAVPVTREDVLTRPGDDAAVLRVGGARQVWTTDHLRAVTRDEALMARIACVHALGDVWAMGAVPQAALASLVLPRMSEALQRRSLRVVLDAMTEVLGAEGADLVGGHTTMGAEATYGLSLTGLLEGEPVGLGGARAGDLLVLTKPVGTGVVLAAEMAGVARGRDVLAVLEAMATPQGAMARRLAGAHAMTDVTGFGLAGHLAAMCRASGVGAEVDPDAVPVHPGALAAVEAGVASSLWAANRRAAPVAAAAGPLGDLLWDPQTSGGLLAAVEVAPEGATVIGRVIEGSGVRVV
ncbi:selenide, water dikinase SelD [Jannaschia sp. Os4]|uniref:selenide, water dikinase SelD n=1 Tax=Jannaschia sp. Os4 TaxID=2807617 RepID=UPI0019396AE3|nr:selenide, water dikinase SelD [Jannaschia sp. Os4]MBM2577758.1 selenide, water dikinase SelD [Jannaschia sp. Os4]